jgi:hypothetical protein
MAHKVLAISELFEHILLGVDAKTLLLAERVDKNFRANINGSKLLQKKLFKLPATPQDIKTLNLVERGDMVMMDHMGKDIAADVKKTHNVWTMEQGGGTESTVVLNPLLLQFLSIPLLTSARLRQNATPPRRHESWMAMRLVQPPIPELDASVNILHRIDSSKVTISGRELLLQNIVSAENQCAWWGGRLCVLGRGLFANNAQLTIYGKYAEGADLAEVGLDVKEVEILD